MLGTIYVAYGERAKQETAKSAASLRRHNDLPIITIDETVFDRPGPGARWAKLNVDRLSPFDYTLYLDADTRVNGDVSAGFGMLGDGWDLLIAPSVNQGHECFRHIGQIENQATLDELENPFPLQLQAGVMFFHRERCARLFAAWRDEWLRFKGQDQAALLRALNREPVRVLLLGRAWNGGELIEHLFGRAR